jgi:hypothetical protein
METTTILLQRKRIAVVDVVPFPLHPSEIMKKKRGRRKEEEEEMEEEAIACTEISSNGYLRHPRKMEGSHPNPSSNKDLWEFIKGLFSHHD